MLFIFNTLNPTEADIENGALTHSEGRQSTGDDPNAKLVLKNSLKLIRVSHN